MKKATDEQVAAIVRIMTSGSMGFEEAQAILDAHANGTHQESEACVLMTERMADLIFVAGKFPGHGEVLMRLLEPFYGWEPELTRPKRELIERARKGWIGECHGVKIVPREQEDWLWGRKKRDVGFIDDERARIWSLKSIEEAQTVEQTAASLKECLVHTPLVRKLGCRFQAVLFLQLAIACRNIIDVGADVSEYAPFFHLWLNGNYPLGLDEESHLLILVAD